MTLIDKDTLRNIKPAYGLVFLFQWSKSEQKDSRPVLKPEECPPELFFANQTVTNACATQAVISILLNRPEVKLGKGALLQENQKARKSKELIARHLQRVLSS